MNRKISFKILTCLIALIFSSINSFAVSIQEENLKTHLRWKLNASKGVLNIDKEGDAVVVKTLDTKSFDDLISELSSLNLNKNYFKKFVSKRGSQFEPSILTLEFKDDTIELFSFYQDKSNSHILDFWINQDLVTTRKAAVSKPKLKPVSKKAKVKIAKKKLLTKPTIKLSDSSIDSSLGVKSLPKKEVEREASFRDFRYGASFIWDYAALIPPLKRDINLDSKAPDFLYTVKDRDLSLSDEKEAHLQLSINFYKKKQWGLMTKSINLYESKYGKDSHRYLNDFMRATSMIKNLIKPYVARNKQKMIEIDGDLVPAKIISDKGVFAAAMSMLENISEGTDDYALKVATLRYLLQVKLEKKDFFQSLSLAKRLYVTGTEQLDDEVILTSTEAILYSLSKLNQVEKLQSFLENKAVKRLLPAQLGDAYISYILLKQEKTDQVIARFVANQKSYARPIHPAILFNTGEAYFREAKYAQAIDVFERVHRNYARIAINSKALNRVALSLDLLDKSEKVVKEAYKKAINRGSAPADQLEARIRYVGYTVLREMSLSELDREIISFLDIREEEKKYLDTNIKKILWQTRLRSFIVQEKYSEALAYISTIPLNTMSSLDRRVFDGDGAEIILGYIKKSYMNEDYAKAIKVWEVYKNEYESKVAKSPYMNFIVADSFIKLGLYESFDRALAAFDSIRENKSRTFPIWVEKHKELSVKDFIVELNIEKMIEQRKWDELAKYLEAYKNNKLINYNYYMGLVSFNKKDYNKCVGLIEKIIVNPNSKKLLSANQKFTMLTTYAESLYQGNDQLRFRKNATAILNDLKRNNFEKNKTTIERISYLVLESLNSTPSSQNYESLISKASDFQTEFKKSTYTDRVDYLKAISLIKTNKTDQGKDVLVKLLNNKGTASYLKGLARTELSSLKLQENTL